MKRIEDIDVNLRVNDTIPKDYALYDPREAPLSIWGLCPNDQGSYCRLPLDLLPVCNEGVQDLAWHLHLLPPHPSLCSSRCDLVVLQLSQACSHLRAFPLPHPTYIPNTFFS